MLVRRAGRVVVEAFDGAVRTAERHIVEAVDGKGTLGVRWRNKAFFCVGNWVSFSLSCHDGKKRSRNR